MNLPALKRKSAEIRAKVVEMIARAKKGHLGGALSCTDILVALYHGGILHVDPRHPRAQERDRFVLSKGHSGTALLAVLADLGFLDPKELLEFNQNGSRLGNNPEEHLFGVEVHTGSLGHGLGLGAGMALAAKMDRGSRLTVVLMSDGECDEGSVWEAFMFAGHHQLSSLIAVIDRNGQCCEDFTESCLRLEPLADKIESFGWDVVTVDGHCLEALLGVMRSLRQRASHRPLAIIANTVKGKGVSYMEGVIRWHHSVPNADEAARALQELSACS